MYSYDLPRMQTQFDYVIVGAGSAGCTLAGRLSEDTDISVLILEAGGWDDGLLIRVPLGWARIFEKRSYDWMYSSGPETTLNDRHIEFARGKVIGGSSSVDAMAYVRGHRADYERWANAGLTKLAYNRVLPYFRKQETWSGTKSEYRGNEGPLHTRVSTYQDPLIDAYLEAAATAGYRLNSDYNGAEQEGFGRLQSTIHNGLRDSVADAYLRPSLKRANLEVLVRRLVTGIRFDRDRAIGVEYTDELGNSGFVTARREVILAGGVVNSPQLLMLSGIGDPDLLQKRGIQVKVPLRGVGKNLKDHLSVAVGYNRSAPGPLHHNMRLDRICVELAKALFFGRGFATDLPSGWTAFIKASSDAVIPDTQLLFYAGPISAKPYLPPLRKAFTDGFACRAVLLRPESSGSITLQSADPKVSPRIVQNAFATQQDRSTLRSALRLVYELGLESPVARHVERPLTPDLRKASDADLDAFVRRTAQTAHHPLGTCRMGLDKDTDSVVDAEFKVRGVQCLRIVDASVMPDCVGGNINAPVVMIAEIAADLVRGRQLLSPANERSPQIRH